MEVPTDAMPGPRWLVPRMDNKTLSPVPVIVAASSVVNESTAAKSSPEAAQDVAVPATIAGRIDVPGEADRYAFAAKKGELFTFEVCARRAQSNLDSILSVYDEKGKRLVESDDVQIHRWSTSDSFLEGWAAPADGKYVVEVSRPTFARRAGLHLWPESHAGRTVFPASCRYGQGSAAGPGWRAGVRALRPQKWVHRRSATQRRRAAAGRAGRMRSHS